MRNILFISDTFTSGGLETRILEETSFYKQHDINSYLICDSFKKNPYSANFKKILPNIQFISSDYKITGQQILQTAKTISDFCAAQKIDLIECQPFWCAISATIAAKNLNLPITYTLHGSKSGNFIDFSSTEASLIFYLCLYYGMDSIVAVSKYLAHLYRHLPQNIIISPNSINISHLNPRKKNTLTGSFAIASRIEPPKTDTLINFLPQLYNSSHTKNIDIYGDGADLSLLQKYVTDRHYTDKINFCGWVPDLQSVLKAKHYDCVFGLGRVIADAIGTSTPAGVVGYGGFSGIVSAENFNHYADNNFISWNTAPSTLLDQELDKLYQNPSNFLLTKSDLQDFSNDYIWSQHLSKISPLKSTKSFIIERLEELLKSHPKNDLLSDKNLLDPLFQLLQTLGGDELLYLGFTNLLSSEYFKLKKQLKDMQESTSWKITKPLRDIKQKFSLDK